VTPAAVTFDFWATLCQDTPTNLECARRMRLDALAGVLAAAGRSFPPAAIATAYDRCGEEIAGRFWRANREPAFRDQVRLCFECLEPGLAGRLETASLDAAAEGYGEPVLHHAPVLMPGALEAVRTLAARGVALGIISNTGRTPGFVLRRVLARWGVLDCFRVITYSDEVGVRKPDGAIFALTLAALGVPPARALHVGDNPRDDVEGARAAGMRAAHYVGDGRPASPEADLVVTDLAELPTRL